MSRQQVLKGALKTVSTLQGASFMQRTSFRIQLYCCLSCWGMKPEQIWQTTLCEFVCCFFALRQAKKIHQNFLAKKMDLPLKSRPRWWRKWQIEIAFFGLVVIMFWMSLQFSVCHFKTRNISPPTFSFISHRLCLFNEVLWVFSGPKTKIDEKVIELGDSFWSLLIWKSDFCHCNLKRVRPLEPF